MRRAKGNWRKNKSSYRNRGNSLKKSQKSSKRTPNELFSRQSSCRSMIVKGRSLSLHQSILYIQMISKELKASTPRHESCLLKSHLCMLKTSKTLQLLLLLQQLLKHLRKFYRKSFFRYKLKLLIAHLIIKKTMSLIRSLKQSRMLSTKSCPQSKKYRINKIWNQ